MHLPSPKHMCTCTSRGAPDTAGDNQNAVVRGGTNKLRRTVRRVLMPVPRLVVQEWVSPAHWQPHLGASRAPWTPEPRRSEELVQARVDQNITFSATARRAAITPLPRRPRDWGW